MYDLNRFFGVLDQLAPLSLSNEMISAGHYDNSGILIKTHSTVNGVLFALDLTEECVKKAIRLKCDTIVTHHPAIYAPIKGLDFEDVSSSAVLLALKYDINVISMHLNLDIADGGIDDSLREGLGGKKYRILDYVTSTNGYGRLFEIDSLRLIDIKNNAKKTFNTKKIICYGKVNKKITKVASFCGAGSSDAERVIKTKEEIDLIVTSDMPHHVIQTIVESGKCIMIIPHYASEEYGFKKYYERAKERLNGQIPFNYFDDKRFR